MNGVKTAAPAEWPTLLLLVACYGSWGIGTTVLWQLFAPAGFLLVVLAITLHSSLQHEVLHGHPFRNRMLSDLTVFPALGLLYPYGRFRDTHLAHHQDERLTDPYDDPESNYLDPGIWETLPRAVQFALRLNNTLAGRMLLGPLVSAVVFLRGDWDAIRAGDARIQDDWLMHLGGVAVVALWLSQAAMPVWAYLPAAYAAMSVLKIRTFLEHRAHEKARGRTVIVEDRGPLALLFLNNNLHVVHHTHPGVAWYRLPAIYKARRDYYLAKNDGYRYGSYAEVFRRHFLRAKDPVPHPAARGRSGA
ncbi:fatty acid desaturase [Frigidibacter oleivorans]|uniref:fatty acid desaturase n=1 Tax=Frigidibacter oleivorans TaxID=2487129 RepID=UPI000F8F23F3|nr:fatty acid desaturase [Frigidibacter oleivorans]